PHDDGGPAVRSRIAAHAAPRRAQDGLGDGRGSAAVKARALGATGYRVSEIGFGAWGLGGEMWRGVDDAEGRKALHEAVEQGITFFDTALAYGTGHSERVIGEEL